MLASTMPQVPAAPRTEKETRRETAIVDTITRSDRQRRKGKGMHAYVQYPMTVPWIRWPPCWMVALLRPLLHMVILCWRERPAPSTIKDGAHAYELWSRLTHWSWSDEYTIKFCLLDYRSYPVRKEYWKETRKECIYASAFITTKSSSISSKFDNRTQD